MTGHHSSAVVVCSLATMLEKAVIFVVGLPVCGLQCDGFVISGFDVWDGPYTTPTRPARERQSPT